MNAVGASLWGRLLSWGDHPAPEDDYWRLRRAPHSRPSQPRRSFSGIGAAAAQSAAAAAPMLEARQQEERQNLWRYAILLLIGALVGESLLGARTA